MNFDTEKLLYYENKLDKKAQKRHFYANALKNVCCFWSEKSGGD